MKNKNVLFIFLIAFLIRLIALNQSLWLDEATTAQTIKHFSYSDLVTRFAPTDFHPPLYYLFMKLWTSVFGYSEVALRIPSVIFSLIAGWFVYLIGKHLKDSKTGMWTAAFFLFNPLIIYYSQEARMYLMAVTFLTASLYYFIRLTKKSRFNDVIAFNIFVALGLCTFYGSVFFIAGMYLYLLARIITDKELRNKNIRLLASILPGSIIALGILSPLLYSQYANAKAMLSLVPNWSMVLGKANAKNLALIPLKFSVGRIQFEPKIAYYLAAGAWTLFVFIYISLASTKNRMLGFLFAAPLVLGFIFSFFTPLLQYFRFLYLIPLYAILIVIGLSHQYKRAMYCAVFFLASFIYLVMPQFHRENWRALSQMFPKNQPIYMVYTSSDPVQYYWEKSFIKDIKTVSDAKGKEVYVIPYTSDIHGVDYASTLKKNKYMLYITYFSRGVTLEKWTK